MGDEINLVEKSRIMDSTAMNRALRRLATEIVEKNQGAEDLYLVGIRRRGVPLAERIRDKIESIEKIRPLYGILDITLYRDDLTTVASSPVLKKTEIPFKVEGRNVILCDDVLFTGRTVRAAMDAILDFGRPRKILLAVLVDRGRRELPIEAQYIGKKIATSTTEIVSVTFKETDGEDDVWLLDREAAKPSPKAAPKAAPAKSPSARRRPRKK